ncbi:hypothetical protein CGRA01v4_05365 [Colletotrichum graminicola]|uniref:Uncharacterized protein n=1 Tax=Colletotrichum graminicola (strain M1.001 / M2 / FGSC 10212) TaxID=645133 RepID=E3Q631_COLGM|nr:uncharacterized protein GLRG_01423 [Colletotrichum graminicola M1.001]EFQ26279.1 hypothetical protein GLRG_01423 [Colletotrichum graminicola M1.001]WDK14084.1 hypothetical protein CGRA01v4_05365 [Colletotrichum graminicola]
MPTDSMEPRIIPHQLPPGMEIAIPPGGELPPQQPMGTYGKKPLPPLPPILPGLRRQLSAYSFISAMSGASKTTTGDSSRSRSRERATPSPSPSPLTNDEIEQLENDINAILIQHTPTPTSRRLSENRSCSPYNRRPESEIKSFAARRLSTPITSYCTLHQSSVKIKQITGLDLEYKGIKKAPPRPPRSPIAPDMAILATPDNSGSVHSAEKPISASEPARTLNMIDDDDNDDDDDDDEDDESDAESVEWDFSPTARRRIPSWIPASPVPPRVEISDFDQASPRRRDSEIGPLRSPGMHHFETLPARRNNHMEVSYVGAKDLYHATATSIANSTQKKLAMAQASIDATQDSGLPPKTKMSFAAKVLQSGRKRPPVGINTMPQSPLSLVASTSSSTSKQSPESGRPDMHAHSMDDDRMRAKYSDTLFRVFGRSGEHRRAASADDTSPDDASPLATLSEAGSAVSTLAVPDSPLSKMGSRLSVQVIAAQFKKTASSMVLSKDERRRENLRQSIRVIPEGGSL